MGLPRDQFQLATSQPDFALHHIPLSPSRLVAPHSRTAPVHAPWLVENYQIIPPSFGSRKTLRSAIYAVYTSPAHPPLANHLPTLIVTPHGMPLFEPLADSILTTGVNQDNRRISCIPTSTPTLCAPFQHGACDIRLNPADYARAYAQNAENYLLTPSPQGDLCVAKLFPPRGPNPQVGKASASDPGHGGASGSRVVRCEASRNLKWSIANTGVISPIYKLALPSPDSPDLPLFQISKPNPNAAFWSMFYFAYAGHNIPPRRIEFGKIQKNPPGPNGGGTRISITGKTPEEKAVWQTLGEGNEDCVEWVVLCAALNLLEYVPPSPDNPRSFYGTHHAAVTQRRDYKGGRKEPACT